MPIKSQYGVWPKPTKWEYDGKAIYQTGSDHNQLWLLSKTKTTEWLVSKQFSLSGKLFYSCIPTNTCQISLDNLI